MGKRRLASNPAHVCSRGTFSVGKCNENVQYLHIYGSPFRVIVGHKINSTSHATRTCRARNLGRHIKCTVNDQSEHGGGGTPRTTATTERAGDHAKRLTYSVTQTLTLYHPVESCTCKRASTTANVVGRLTWPSPTHSLPQLRTSCARA